MQQIKVFHGHKSEPNQLEEDVNAWLKSSGVKVINMFGNISPQAVMPVASERAIPGAISTGGTRRFADSDIMLVVVYEA
ncbi:MAG: hypothetical protein H6815_06845 [Phycisphaeraceae bacterium]|nr:hypothetical protein [Phycisphaerales bacterium]MCB9860156.1 hypothetical protein [Phycisphaeraceae bacterium]